MMTKKFGNNVNKNLNMICFKTNILNSAHDFKEIKNFEITRIMCNALNLVIVFIFYLLELTIVLTVKKSKNLKSTFKFCIMQSC